MTYGAYNTHMKDSACNIMVCDYDHCNRGIMTIVTVVL